MMSEQVSIVIPVYNAQRTLGDCLGSVLKQTYRDFEVILAYTDSRDDTLKIIKRFKKKDGRIKLVRVKKRGRGRARNAGIEACESDIVVWLDSDCVAPQNWLKKLIGPILDGKAVAVQGTSSSQNQGCWSIMAHRAEQRHFKKTAYKKNYIDHMDTKNMAIKRDVLIDNGSFNSHLNAAEDLELYTRLKINGYDLYFVKNARIEHLHRDTFKGLLYQKYEQGFWTVVVYYLHKDYYDGLRDKGQIMNSLSFVNNLMLPVHFSYFLLTHIPTDSFYELVTIIAWRFGNIHAHIKRKEIISKMK